MTLPETLLEALPSSPLAFRLRTVLSLSPAQIARLKVYREGKIYELAAPTAPGSSTHWRMVAPVAAPADEESITKLVMLLSKLDAEAYVTDQIGDGQAYGLNAPTMAVTWTLSPEAAAADPKQKEAAKATPKADAKAKAEGTPREETGTLRIGKKVPRSELSYANIEGSPIVFTLRAATIAPLAAEFHTHRIMAFSADQATRLVLRWPDRSLEFRTQEQPGGKGIAWVPESAASGVPFDVSRLGNLVATLSNLHTPRFLQYRGEIPATTGLTPPRLEIEVHLAGGKAPRVLRLRLGRSNTDQAYATTATGASGTVFLVTGAAWDDLIRRSARGPDLPEDVFAPEPSGPAKEGTPAPAP
jgi:hypothetical protein